MKFFVLAMIMFLPGLFYPEQQSSFADQAAQAGSAYQSGDYGKAIQIYENLVLSGLDDGALYFDLGSAYYQAGNLGQALFNFRRAQQFMPRDVVLNSAIGLIRARRVDIQPDETSLLAGMAAITTSVMTQTELNWLVWLLWVVGGGLLATRIIRPQWQARLRTPLVTCGVLIGIGLTLLSARMILNSTRPPAVLIEDNVVVMSGPGEQYLDLFDLHSAAEMRIVEMRADWAWIELPDGRQGWVTVASIGRLS